MNKLVITVLAFVLTGCGTWPSTQDKFMASEVVFHTLNVIDQAQSANAISRGCFHEANPLTRELLGEKPKAQEFALYGAAISLGFHYLNRSDYITTRPKLRTAVNLFAIGAKGYAVAHNYNIGMRVSGSNPGCASQ